MRACCPTPVSYTHLDVYKRQPKFCAEGNVLVAGRDLYADATADTMYAAIDLLTDKLDRLLVKHKEKMVNHHRGENPVRDGTFG